MAYQLDYKKVFNTFGPKNRKERYGTGIGDHINNLIPSINTQLPARYGLFYNKDDIHEIYNPSIVYNGIRMIWPEKNNTWYYLDSDIFNPDIISRNVNFCVGKQICAEYSPNSNCKVMPLNYHTDGYRLDNKLYGPPEETTPKGFINIPVKSGQTYCLQFINNYSNIIHNPDGRPKIFLFAEGIGESKSPIRPIKTIFLLWDISSPQNSPLWSKEINQEDPRSFACFFKIPEETILSSRSSFDEEASSNCYIKITNYILGISYPYTYKIDGNNFTLYDSSKVQGFLWESDKPALVDQSGTIIEYVNEEWEEWTAIPQDDILPVMTDKEVESILLQPYQTNEGTTIDARVRMTKINDSITFSAAETNNPFDVRFKNWLWVNRKDFIIAPVRLHLNGNEISRRMIGERGNRFYSSARARRLVGNVNLNKNSIKMPNIKGTWSNGTWTFPSLSYEDLQNKISYFLGIDGYNQSNNPYSTIGFCFSVRNKKIAYTPSHNQDAPGGLYADYLPEYRSTYFIYSTLRINVTNIVYSGVFNETGTLTNVTQVGQYQKTYTPAELEEETQIQKVFTFTVPEKKNFNIVSVSFETPSGKLYLEDQFTPNPVDMHPISTPVVEDKTIYFRMESDWVFSLRNVKNWEVSVEYSVTYIHK